MATNSGRTMWDYVHEHPYISMIVILLLSGILLYLILHGYNVSSSGITPPVQAKIDTLKLHDSAFIPMIREDNIESKNSKASKKPNQQSANTNNGNNSVQVGNNSNSGSNTGNIGGQGNSVDLHTVIGINNGINGDVNINKGKEQYLVEDLHYTFKEYWEWEKFEFTTLKTANNKILPKFKKNPMIITTSNTGATFSIRNVTTKSFGIMPTYPPDSGELKDIPLNLMISVNE